MVVITQPSQHSDAAARPTRLATALQLVRTLCHLVTVVVVAVWAFTSWPMPWPGLLAGFGLTALAILCWAVFLSPRPVLHAERFLLTLVELLFAGAGVGAMLALNVPWPVAVGFGLVAAALGYSAPERRQ